MTEPRDPQLDEAYFAHVVRQRRIAANCCGDCGTRLIRPFNRPSRCPHCHADDRRFPSSAGNYAVYQDGEIDHGT